MTECRRTTKICHNKAKEGESLCWECIREIANKAYAEGQERAKEVSDWQKAVEAGKADEFLKNRTKLEDTPDE